MHVQNLNAALLSLFAASAVFLVTPVSAGSQCYYLDGTPAGGVYRCDNSTSGESSCCNAGQICYSNGVCQAGPTGHVSDWLRVGCTDKTWNSPACLKQCTTLVPASSCGIRPCGGILTSNQYCCDTQGKGPGSLACCSNSSNLFPLPIPSIIATIPLNAAATGPASSQTASLTNSGSATVITATTTVAGNKTTATAATSNSYFFSSNTTSTSPAPSTSSSTSTSSASSATSGTGTSTKPTTATATGLATKLGASLGMFLGTAFFGGLFFML